MLFDLIREEHPDAGGNVAGRATSGEMREEKEGND